MILVLISRRDSGGSEEPVHSSSLTTEPSLNNTQRQAEEGHLIPVNVVTHYRIDINP